MFTSYPIASMYGIFTYIYQKNQPNVAEYTVQYMDCMGTCLKKKTARFFSNHNLIQVFSVSGHPSVF